MQKTEYTCDRCGTAQPAERMFHLDIKHAYYQIDYGNTLDEHLAGLKRSNERTQFDAGKDLCNNCLADFRNWLESGR